MSSAPTISPTLFRLFVSYLRRWSLPRHFHGVRLAGGIPALSTARPVIIYTNHPGWWDPALFFLLAGTYYPRHRHYGPMDADSLRHYGFFARLGVFPVERAARRGAARFLRVAGDILARPDAVLWVTAEGAFTDARQRPVRLRPGVAHLARAHPEALLLPLALEYVYWDDRKPEALLRFGRPAAVEALEAELEAAMNALAAAAMTRDPARFTTIVRGFRAEAIAAARPAYGAE